MNQKQIVKNIKTTRQSKQMSLGRLVELCGSAKGYMPEIENPDKAPPLSTSSKVAVAVDTDISLSLTEESEARENLSLCMARRDQRKEGVLRGTL